MNAAREIAEYAVMTDQPVTIRAQRTGGHWYIVARRENGDELVRGCDSWNDAQRQVAEAKRIVSAAAR